MNNLDFIFGGIRPQIKLNDSNTPFQGCYDGNITAVTAQLVSFQVGVVACEYEVV